MQQSEDATPALQ
jgi:dynein heavy chain